MAHRRDARRRFAVCVIILTRRGDRIAAFRNKCPHAGYAAQRADGRIVLQQGAYRSAAHMAQASRSTRRLRGGPCNGEALERIAIVIRGGAICVA